MGPRQRILGLERFPCSKAKRGSAKLIVQVNQTNGISRRGSAKLIAQGDPTNKLSKSGYSKLIVQANRTSKLSTSGYSTLDTRRTSRPSRGATNVWVSALVIFALLISYTHTTTCLRALTHNLASTCTFLERTIAHAVNTQESHTPPSDQDGVPVRWVSRSGNLRTRGKRLITPNPRTYRGCKKWANHPATTKPK